MSIDEANSVHESVAEIVEHAWKATTHSDPCNAILPNRIVQLITDISPGHYFEAFLHCHRHLNQRINENLKDKNDDKSAFITSQLKLCFHERDHYTHSCVYKILVSYFTTFKAQTTPLSLDDTKLLSKLIEFVGGFSCISQITNILDLFTDNFLDHQELISLTQVLIDRNCHIHAAIVINRFDIRHHFDSNYLLTELLYEDNLQDIEQYLELERTKFDNHNLSFLLVSENINDIEKQQHSHYILLNYMQYLDKLFTQIDCPDVQIFQRLKTTQRKQFVRKIYRYVFDLFKRPIFEQLGDNELYNICPNITRNFYGKQLAGLFFRFKEQKHVPLSANVMSDHVNALNDLTIASELIPQAHSQALAVFAKRNEFSSANEYIRNQNLTFNLYNGFPDSQNSSELISYPLNLSLHNGIIIVENDQQFDEFLANVQKLDFISYDSEWFNNYFLLRSNTVVSLIQIAHDNICYLIDCVTLSKSKPLHYYLGKIITDIINNEAIIKIGYSIHNDFEVIWKSYMYSLKQDEPLPERKCITLSPSNLLDFRELYTYLIMPSNQLRDIFDQTRLTIASHLSGISQVTYALTGYSIDKTEQLSDWSKRPFRNSQIRYATIDACCLVDCYRELEKLFSVKSEIPFHKFIQDFQTKLKVLNYESKEKNKSKSPLSEEQAEIINNENPLPINQFRCVVDDMLFGIIRYLRICNADTLTADPKDRDKSVRLALKENRVFITSGQVFERYRKHFDSPSDCIRLSNAHTSLEQFKELVTKCRLLIRLEDLFARCSLCNTTPFIIISREEFKTHFERYLAQTNGGDTAVATVEQPSSDETICAKMTFSLPSDNTRSYSIDFEQFSKMKFIHKMPQVDKFYICPNCGHVYWDGCHSSNFIHSIKSLIVDA